MNFFDHQDHARRQTRWLIGAFLLAVLAIVLAMNLVALLTFGGFPASADSWFSAELWRANAPLLLTVTTVTLVVIGIASAWRTMQLRGGGARVALELGGIPVDGATSDPLRRRLLNVVEEMAIASGVPVPQVFVLEHESGINAFAAGWSPNDAAVAVTRGALEALSREELQGVIAHEFSHVFNGDMRLNIRLMGVLFGILIIAVAGRRMLSSMRFAGRGRNRNAGAIVLVALAVMIIGYIGLFFGRWIQAAISRQREYLADASAVQFTRSPDGIGGALKKIGASVGGSRLAANADEVGHMLFANGLASQLLATHPPLVRRIRKIDPGFDPAQFVDIARSLTRQSQARLAEAEQVEHPPQPDGIRIGPIVLDPGQLGERIGAPDASQFALVAALLVAIPEGLKRAAHSDHWAVEVVLYLLLARDPALREQQLIKIAQARGAESEARVRELRGVEPSPALESRLPLLELAFPLLRRRPEDERIALMRLVDELARADGQIEVFEYVLARLLAFEVERSLNPSRKAPGGRAGLADLAAEVSDLVHIIAAHGHDDQSQSHAKAVSEACEHLAAHGVTSERPAPAGDWRERLDEILRVLPRLSLRSRGELIQVLLVCATSDGEIQSAEYELLRLVAGLLEVPLPLAAKPSR